MISISGIGTAKRKVPLLDLEKVERLKFSLGKSGRFEPLGALFGLGAHETILARFRITCGVWLSGRHRSAA